MTDELSLTLQEKNHSVIAINSNQHGRPLKAMKTTECEGQCWGHAVDSHEETVSSVVWGREIERCQNGIYV